MYKYKVYLLWLQLGAILVSAADPGIEIPKDGNLPILTLPYAAYRAVNYTASGDIYTFKNIRYAAAPVGDLRWAKPAPPRTESSLQDGSYGPHCIQTGTTSGNLVGPGNQSPIGGALNQFLGGIPVPLFNGGKEDCLFLDVYVPGKAVRDPSMKLPVAVFIYGGAFLFGSKDAFQPDFPFYDGTGLLQSSGDNMIFVTMNYRLGAFGFLAGTTMEKEGVPNAGLWDQRAAFQWVKDNIHLLGGDPNDVTAIGQSAGAGAIMHHMVAEGGTLDPLFKKAVLQSLAYQWKWDRDGQLQDVFEGFASKAGCQGKGLSCLRSAQISELSKANDALGGLVAPGSYAIGPSADGSYIRQLPNLEIAAGKFWNMESVIVSHCADESSAFVSGNVTTDAQFASFINELFPAYANTSGLDNIILKAYPPVGLGIEGPYLTETQRFEAFLRDSCFTCHGRHVTEGLKKGSSRRVWNMQYSAAPGTHSSDLLPTFYNSNLSTNSVLGSLVALLTPLTAVVLAGLSVNYQSYLTSYITTGDPNTNRLRNSTVPTIPWGQPDTSQEQITGVLDVGDLGFSIVADTQNLKTACDFWRKVAAAVTNDGGYAPPDAVVPQDLIDTSSKDPSYRFKSGSGTHGSTGSGGPSAGGQASLGAALMAPLVALLLVTGPMLVVY